MAAIGIFWYQLTAYTLKQTCLRLCLEQVFWRDAVVYLAPISNVSNSWHSDHGKVNRFPASCFGNETLRLMVQAICIVFSHSIFVVPTLRRPYTTANSEYSDSYASCSSLCSLSLPIIIIYADFCVQRYEITSYKVSKLIIILTISTFLMSIMVVTPLFV